MKASLIAVGTELLRFRHRDTNSLWLIDELQGLGIDTVEWVQVTDEVGRIAEAVRRCAMESDLVIVSGGMGPTEDDRTREALAIASGRPLERDPDRVEALRSLFREHGLSVSSNNEKQADRPVGAQWLENPVGSAPGLFLQICGATVGVLPGVPSELRAMFVQSLQPHIELLKRPHTRLHTMRIAGRIESSLDAQLRDLYTSDGVEVTLLSGRGELLLRLLSRGATPDDAARRLQTLADAIRQRIDADIYADGEMEIFEVVGQLLRARGWTLATAESCTGGRIGFELTEVAGSSTWYRGGWIVYSNALKQQLAGISDELLIEHGAVSEPVARQLAQAVRLRCDADFGLAVTGVAGPGGGSPEKPVGTVHIALATPDSVLHWKIRFAGGRNLVRARTSLFALDRLRRLISGLDTAVGRG